MRGGERGELRRVVVARDVRVEIGVRRVPVVAGPDASADKDVADGVEVSAAKLGHQRNRVLVDAVKVAR